VAVNGLVEAVAAAVKFDGEPDAAEAAG